MRKVFSLLLLLILSITTAAQNKNNEKDSTLTKPFINRYFEYLKNESSLPVIRPEDFLIQNNSDTTQSGLIWLRTKLEISNRIRQSSPDASLYLLQPYYNFYVESKKISLFRRMLGMAQLGAVGYMAYRHIKKYGLFRQP